MTDYNSLKVPDLKALLGQRKLLQTGNKQALITRLQEDDEKNAAPAASKEEAKPDVDKEDEISYSDDEANASSKPQPAASKKESPATVSISKETKPEELPASKAEEVAPARNGSVEKTDESAAANASSTATDAADAPPTQSFTIGLASTAAEDEAKKRAERAKRFGIEEDDDAKRRADRAKRFGIDQTELASGLDAALPERPLKRSRGGVEGNGPGKRQNPDRKGRHAGGGGGNNNSSSNNDNNRPSKGQQRGGGGGRSILDDAAEKAKAEKRAARFATA